MRLFFQQKMVFRRSIFCLAVRLFSSFVAYRYIAQLSARLENIFIYSQTTECLSYHLFREIFWKIFLNEFLDKFLGRFFERFFERFFKDFLKIFWLIYWQILDRILTDIPKKFLNFYCQLEGSISDFLNTF